MDWQPAPVGNKGTTAIGRPIRAHHGPLLAALGHFAMSAFDPELTDASPETGHSKIEKGTFLDTSARSLTATRFDAR